MTYSPHWTFINVSLVDSPVLNSLNNHFVGELTDAVIGFEQTEVTVIEGEDAILTTFFRANQSNVDYRGELFTVFSQVGKGNATGKATQTDHAPIAKIILKS